MKWVPRKSVGEIIFGESLQSIMQKYDLVRDPDIENKIVNEKAYEIISDGLTVYTDQQDKITSVICDKICEINGKNLIGMNVKDALSLVGYSPLRKPDDHFDLDWGKQDVYELDELAVQLWELDGRIESVVCFNWDIEEE